MMLLQIFINEIKKIYIIIIYFFLIFDSKLIKISKIIEQEQRERERKCQFKM